MTRFNKFSRHLLIVLLGMLWCALAVQQPAWLEKIERWSLDRHLRSLPWTAPEPQIVLVEAGERTFAELKAWPWSRRHHADLINHLAEADTVVVDILFPETGDRQADRALSEAVRRQGNTITAMHLVETAPGAAPRRVFPYAELHAAARRTGYTNVNPDIDGLVRFALPLRRVRDALEGEHWVPSLSVAAARHALDAPPAYVARSRTGRHRLHLGDRRIPVDNQGRLWLQYAPHPYPVYEYADVLAGRWPPETFHGKVVVIGVAASGAEDFYMVPGAGENQVISGARLNAEIIRSLLVGEAPTRARPIVDLAVTALMMALAAGLGGSAHRWRSSLVFLGLCLTFAGVNRYLFMGHLHWINLTVPLMGSTTAFFSALFLRHRWQHADLAFRTFSMAAILRLSELQPPADQTLEDYLGSIWPEIHKATGVAMVAARTSAAAALGEAFHDHGLDNGQGSGNIIAFKAGAGRDRRRFQLLIPYAQGDKTGETTYVHLGSRRPIPRSLSETLATLVTAISWFFGNLEASRRRKQMLIDTIHAIFTAVDFKDPITGGHSNRVSDISKEIIDALDLDPEQAEDIYLGSLIHDIGKIGIPDAVLNKPGRLTDEEFDLIRSHPDIGRNIMAKVALPEETVNALYHHHERYDGSGYPKGLKAEEISLAGRIVAVADVFDALSAKRPYRDPMPLDEVCDFIEQRMGTEFDPRIVRILLDLKKYQHVIAQRPPHPDPQPAAAPPAA